MSIYIKLFTPNWKHPLTNEWRNKFGIFIQWNIGCMLAKLLQSCLTLCIPMDYSLPGSSVQGILQVRILWWVTMPSSRGSSWPRDLIHVSYVPALASGFFTISTTWEAHKRLLLRKKRSRLLIYTTKWINLKIIMLHEKARSKR